MNIMDKTRELMSSEMIDRLTIESLEKSRRLIGGELEARMMDHYYHHEQKFRMLWNLMDWETQIQMAVRFKANIYYKSFLDSVQLTAYMMLV